MLWAVTNVDNVAQFSAVLCVKDGGLWEGNLQSQLGTTVSRRLSQQLELVEGDLLALSAGDTTQAVSLHKPFSWKYVVTV